MTVREPTGARKAADRYVSGLSSSALAAAPIGDFCAWPQAVRYFRAAGCSGRCLLSAAGVGAEAPADRPGILDSKGAVAVAGVFDLPGDLQAGLDPVIEIIGLWRDDVEPVRGRPVPGPDDDNAAAAVGQRSSISS